MTRISSRDGGYDLVPEEGIEIVEGRTIATSTSAWLRIEPVRKITRHRWIRLRYASSFFDEPVRPLIRFTTKTGQNFIQAMNGTAIGSADWIGRVPDETASVAISPCRRPGPFSFRIDEIGSVSRSALVTRGILRDPLWVYWALRSRLVNSRQEAWQALKYAATATPMAEYAAWRAKLVRPPDLTEFDRPRADWQRTPTFRLLLRLDSADAADLQATLAALHDQVYPRWCLYALGGEGTPAALAVFRNAMRSEPRLREITPDGWQGLAGELDPDDRLMVIDAGDTLVNFALAAFAEELAYAPRLAVIYADEDAVTPNGLPHSPIFKPDWSPIYHAVRRYIGRAVCIRFGSIAAAGATGVRRLLIEEDIALDEILHALPRQAIRHLRRPLYRRTRPAPVHGTGGVPAAHTQPIIPSDPQKWPLVGIIIPSRDHAELLAECIHGLKEKTDYPSIEVVVVDNGSATTDALALLRDIEADPRFKVLKRPGSFNFSALCNEGVRETKASILLFLNNDIAMQYNNWLKPLVRWAIRPDIGAVGAKLLFPSGRIQHAGVVLGLGGICGHLYRNMPGNYRGYCDRLTVPHEVAAVTAACMAIERTKFEAVGGFDAENLPIDLNDIDLCLRIAERGWTNLRTPEAVLIHHQSGSRGIERDPFTEYRKERGYFVRRWAHLIRDDPYFHSSLSLFARDVELA
jgi:GT2 family glycosyltransferase